MRVEKEILIESRNDGGNRKGKEEGKEKDESERELGARNEQERRQTGDGEGGWNAEG